MDAPVAVVCCYAREDEEYLGKLRSHLKPLQYRGVISAWHDRDISPGADYNAVIKEQLDNAQIILLLISSDFLASEYCYGVELQRALRRHGRQEAVAVPIILRPCRWQDTAVGQLQALPTDGKPIAAWHDQDEAFLSVYEGIFQVIETLRVRAERQRAEQEEQARKMAEERRRQERMWAEQEEQARKVEEERRHQAWKAEQAKQRASQRSLVEAGKARQVRLPQEKHRSHVKKQAFLWPEGLRSPLGVAVLIMLSLFLLGGGGFGVYGTLTGHLPWSRGISAGTRNTPVGTGSASAGIIECLSAVAWGNSQFVAVGGSGTILTSRDGQTWTKQTS